MSKYKNYKEVFYVKGGSCSEILKFVNAFNYQIAK